MSESTLKLTPLNAVHREMGARMVDFGGWDMPVHYGSQIEEHHCVRRDCGMFDVSHMLVVDLRGAGCRSLLSYVLANNVERLRQPGKALYSCMLNAAGGVIDDLIVYFLAEDWFRLVVNAATAAKDVAWLSAQRDEREPRIELSARQDLAMLAVQGPHARMKVYQALPGSEAAAGGLAFFNAAQMADTVIARTGYTGEDGFEIMLPVTAVVALWSRLRELGVAAAGLGARDTLRLEGGLNLYGQDMDETTTPLEAGLAWTVDLQAERDFIGKDALRASRPQRHALGLVLLDKGGPRGHQRVLTRHGEGEITSGSFGPTMNRSIALARVPLAVAPGDGVDVEGRGKILRAKVVKPPFVRNGRILVDI